MLHIIVPQGSTEVASISGFNKQSAIAGLALLDLAVCLSFFIFCLFFIVWTRRLARKADDSTITIKDYAVRVKGLPESTSADEVKAFFMARWGPAVRVDQ